MNLKNMIWIFVILMISTVGFAECFVEEDCYVYQVVNETTFDQVTVEIFNPDGFTVVAETNMSEQETNLWFKIIQPQESGNHTAQIRIYNASVQQATYNQTYLVEETRGLLTKVCPTTTGTTLTLWLFIAFFLVIALFGFGSGMMFMSLLGSLGIVFSSLVVIGCSAPMGLIVMAIGLIMAISSLVTKT